MPSRDIDEALAEIDKKQVRRKCEAAEPRQEAGEGGGCAQDKLGGLLMMTGAHEIRVRCDAGWRVSGDPRGAERSG